MRSETAYLFGHPAFHVHVRSIVCHYDDTGHLGFINRIPLPERIKPSIIEFVMSDSDMHAVQIPTPKGVPLAVSLSEMTQGLPGHRDALYRSLNGVGHYVGLAVILPMVTVALDDVDTSSVTLETVSQSPHARRAPGLIATHDGSVITAQYSRKRSAYRPLPVDQTHNPDGTEAELLKAHRMMCEITDTPPRRPRQRRAWDDDEAMVHYA